MAYRLIPTAIIPTFYLVIAYIKKYIQYRAKQVTSHGSMTGIRFLWNGTQYSASRWCHASRDDIRGITLYAKMLAVYWPAAMLAACGTLEEMAASALLAEPWLTGPWLAASRMAATQAVLAEQMGLVVVRLVQPLVELVVAPRVAETLVTLARQAGLAMAKLVQPLAALVMAPRWQQHRQRWGAGGSGYREAGITSGGPDGAVEWMVL
jgi:hypothetical protein